MIKKGQKYFHYKNKNITYQILDIATHSETEEKMVIYYNIETPEKIWVRPYDVFAEHIPDGRKRFTLIEE